MKAIKPAPMWVTKTWSSEIEEGVGFTINQLRSEWSQDSEPVIHFMPKGGTWRHIEQKHAHSSYEEALSTAKREIASYADYNENQSAQYKQSAMKCRSELMALNQL